jgi:hypothetical protein
VSTNHTQTPDPLSDPSAAQYQPIREVSPPPHAAGHPSGALPFTGLDALALALVALALVLTGIALRRLSRAR